MNIISVSFILFLLVLLVLYFTVCRKYQWQLLLVASMVFYCISDARNIIFILLTAASTFFSAKWIHTNTLAQKQYLKENKGVLTKEERNVYKTKQQTYRKRLLVVTLILNFGILCVFKYLSFVIDQANNMLGIFSDIRIQNSFCFLIPLGISFYTFQSTGYLLDVYWNKCPAEQNFLKQLLFTSFFPQIIQGPISTYAGLSKELFLPHTFTYHNYSYGCQRMIWGFFKKIAIADILSVYVADIFANYTGYTGLTALVGAFMYSVQIYADFSGYMDIMCGLCQILGIRLTENFMRPYFSKSVSEYWRRWHTSLGTWFSSYIYYPIAMSKWNQRIGKWAKSKLGKSIGQYLPATTALMVVWLSTGLWHGASWAYIAWGGVNGLFIILQLWLDSVYGFFRKKLRITDTSRLWRCIRVIRTFILITFIKVLPEVGTLAQGWGLWIHICTSDSVPTSFSQLLPNMNITHFVVVSAGTLLMLIASLVQRRERVRDWFSRFPAPIRYLVLAGLIVICLYYGTGDTVGGFMYARF